MLLSGVSSSTQPKQQTDTHLPGLESRGAGLSKGQYSRRGRSLLVGSRSRLHTSSGWLRVCCWAVMCCVRAGRVAEGVAARRHIHDTPRRTRFIRVLDRSHNSPFYSSFGAVGRSVHNFLRAWSATGSNRICHTDEVVLGPTFHRVESC